MAGWTRIDGAGFQDGKPRWRTQYRDPTGHQVVRQFRTEGEAREWLRQVAHDRVDGTLTDARAGRQTLQELYDEVHAVRRYAPATLSMHALAWKHVPDAVRKRASSSVTVADVDRVLARVQAPAMRAKLQSVLSLMFTWAIHQRRLAVNPAKKSGIRRTRAEEVDNEGAPKRVLSVEEVSRLIAAMPPRHRALIQVMAAVGPRPSEALALRAVDFDPMQRTLKINGTKTSGSRRTIVLPVRVAEALQAHIEEFGSWDPDALIFTTESGAAIDLHNFRARTFAPAAKRADVNHGLRIYDLRHTAASVALMNGVPIPAVAAMLGHVNPTVTLAVYAHVLDSDQRRLADRLDEVLTWAEPRDADIRAIQAGP